MARIELKGRFGSNRNNARVQRNNRDLQQLNKTTADEPNKKAISQVVGISYKKQ